MLKKVMFNDFVRLGRGFDLPDDKIVAGEYPVVTSTNIKAYHNEYKILPPVVVTGRSGSLGKVQYIDEKCWPLNTALYSKDFRNNVPRYVCYFLQTMHLEQYNAGAGVPTLNQNHLHRLKINIHEIEEQEKVVSVLSTYDELIANNNKRIKLLEQMSENLYKEWFVRFRFPNHENTEFENGIPKGWRVVPVKETFEIFDTERIPVSSMDRDKMQKIYPYYGAAELMDYVDDYLFDGIYLLLGEDGSVITPKGKPVLQYVWGKFWVNNHAHVLQGKYPFSTEYLHLMFGQMDITGIVTGAAQPKISQGRLLKKKTILPTEDLVVRFDSIIQPIYQKIRKLSEANNNLIKQRDLLLPRLMSGKLEV